MHLTFHYALGVIFASILSRLTPLSPFLFGIIVLAAFLPDFDILLSKFAPNHNHRQLISHSLFIPVISIAFGVIFRNIIITFFGLSYLSHVIVDLLDWGTNFLYNGKTYGPRILLKKEEYSQVSEMLKLEKVQKWFFVRRYYASYPILVLEIIGLFGMCLFLLFWASAFWYFGLGYLLAISFHIMEYYVIQQALKKFDNAEEKLNVLR